MKKETERQQRLRRLRMLSFMLENHKKIFNSNVHFDMTTWAKESFDCKTAACALGSACMHKPFIKEGLKMSDRIDPFTLGLGIKANILVPVFDGFDGFEAGEKFFNISEKECEWVFDPCLYGPSRAAFLPFPVCEISVKKRVDFLIKHYQKHKTKTDGRKLGRWFGIDR